MTAVTAGLSFAPPALAPAPIAPGFILLVEDNPGDARLTQSLLENTADVTWPALRWVQTLAGAIQTLEDEPDCKAVLLDLGLPDAQGLESLQAILPHAAHRPVVVLTGDGSEAIGLPPSRPGRRTSSSKAASMAQCCVAA